MATWTDINLWISLLSLGLAVVFWVLSTRQADEARRVLKDIQTAMLTWQAELNKTTLDILASRPEMIAKQISLLEANATAEYFQRLTNTIEKLCETPHEEKVVGFQINALDRLLAHQKSIILDRDRIKANVIMKEPVGTTPDKC